HCQAVPSLALPRSQQKRTGEGMTIDPRALSPIGSVRMIWKRVLGILLPALLVCRWSHAAELESSDAEAVIASSDQFATAPAWIALSKDAEDAGLNDGLWTITYELTPKGKALFADLTVRSKAY